MGNDVDFDPDNTGTPAPSRWPDRWLEQQTYLAKIRGDTEITSEHIVRAAAENGWGVISSIQMLMQHFGMSLHEAKGLTYTICDEHGLRTVYEAACRALDPNYPHGQKKDE